jgi:hypothetical protein
MESIVRSINELRDRKVIGDYAIAGSFAFIYYSTPFETRDLDVMAVLPETDAGLIDLEPIWTHFIKQGAKAEGQFLRMGLVLLDIVPASDALDEEAVREAEQLPIGNETARILSAEHAIAVALRTNRPKDRLKIAHLLDVSRRPIDFTRLEEILRRHGLLTRWRRLQVGLRGGGGA